MRFKVVGFNNSQEIAINQAKEQTVKILTIVRLLQNFKEFIDYQIGISYAHDFNDSDLGEFSERINDFLEQSKLIMWIIDYLKATNNNQFLSLLAIDVSCVVQNIIKAILSDTGYKAFELVGEMKKFDSNQLNDLANLSESLEKINPNVEKEFNEIKVSKERIKFLHQYLNTEIIETNKQNALKIIEQSGLSDVSMSEIRERVTEKYDSIIATRKIAATKLKIAEQNCLALEMQVQRLKIQAEDLLNRVSPEEREALRVRIVQMEDTSSYLTQIGFDKIMAEIQIMEQRVLGASSRSKTVKEDICFIESQTHVASVCSSEREKVLSELLRLNQLKVRLGTNKRKAVSLNHDFQVFIDYLTKKIDEVKDKKELPDKLKEIIINRINGVIHIIESEMREIDKLINNIQVLDLRVTNLYQDTSQLLIDNFLANPSSENIITLLIHNILDSFSRDEENIVSKKSLENENSKDKNNLKILEQILELLRIMKILFDQRFNVYLQEVA